MGRLLPALLLAMLLSGALAWHQAAAERFGYVDQAAQKPDFAAYRSRLIAAVRERDMQAVLKFVHPNIQLSFGGHSGHDEMRTMFEEDPSLWDELERVLTRGGVFNKDGTFIAPFLQGYDKGEIGWGVVFGSDVPLRARPSENGKIVASLDYTVVEVVDAVLDEGAKPYPRATWYKIDPKEGRPQGYVPSDLLHEFAGYRAIFEREGGAWRMTYFLAGD